VVIVSTLLEEDRRKSCEEIAHEANMSTASVFRIVTQTLEKRKVAAKWVPHQLSEEQKAAHKRVAEELLQRYCLRFSIGNFGKVWMASASPPAVQS
jgi:histone-lysine N-methyltransferase SETMAR